MQSLEIPDDTIRSHWNPCVRLRDSRRHAPWPLEFLRKAADATCRRATTQPRCPKCGRRQSAPRASKDDVEALNSAPRQPSERRRHSPGAAQGNGKCHSRPCILRVRAFASRRASSRSVAAGLPPSTRWTPTRRTGRLLRLAHPDGSGSGLTRPRFWTAWASRAGRRARS